MPRDQVFISYSHKDEADCALLCGHLRRELTDSRVTAWVDSVMPPGSMIDQTIRDAIGRTRVAVLLVSPNFLSSDFIRTIELPLLLAAKDRGELELTWLALEPVGLERRLIEFLGLNNAKVGLSAAPDVRKRELLEAAGKIATLGRSNGNPRVATTGHVELVVDLVDHQDSIDITYRFDGHHREARSPRPTPSKLSGEDLFALVFPPLAGSAESEFDRLAREWFGHSGRPAITPLGVSLRLRLRSTAPWLMHQPWRTMTWQQQRLAAVWRFELLGGEPTNDLTLSARADDVCLVLPGSAPSAAAHARTVRSLIEERWGALPPGSCASREQASARLHAARVVYVFANARVHADRVQIELEANAASATSAWVVLDDLFAQADPDLLFLNLVWTQRAPWNFPLGGFITKPRVAILNAIDSERASNAREAAHRWLAQVLDPSAWIDPVQALETSGLQSALCWTRYAAWRGVSAHHGPRAPRIAAYLVTDRERQRGAVREAMEGLLRDSRRRVVLFVVYGASGNLVHLVGEQAEQFVIERSTDMPIRRHPADLRSADASLDDFVTCFETAIGADQGIRSALRQEYEKGKAPDVPFVVVMVDWLGRRVQTTKEALDLVRACAEFSAQRLATEVPDEVRVVQTFGIECEASLHVQLRSELQSLEIAFFDTTKFDLVTLDPLESVTAKHIALAARQMGATDADAKEIGLLIHHQTDGTFESTTAWLDKARLLGWRATRDELRGLRTTP